MPCPAVGALCAYGASIISPMTAESIPKFTGPAAKQWANISADAEKRLLTNAWCGWCRHEVTITNFTGVVKAGNLLLA